MKKASSKSQLPNIVAVDLFCGAGGLTKGLEKAGIRVQLGVDIDPACKYPYEANNGAKFLLKDIKFLKSKGLGIASNKKSYLLLAGCAPCQPFSKYSQGRSIREDERWNLLKHFSRLIRETKPHFVTMENVPKLAEQKIFKVFVSDLRKSGYEVGYQIVNCVEYGVPQQRSRLVLLASKLGPISLLAPKRSDKKTVRQAIGSLPSLRAGQVHPRDRLHQSCVLSNTNLKRIRASKPGGSWRDWNKSLVAKCHSKKTGKTYPSVYGRMVWDEPSPTITTQFYGFGNGRFGHPIQDRALSLREGAIIQSFPKSYKFVPSTEPVYRKTIGRLIGNAVPVKLAEAIGQSLVAHVESHKKRIDQL